MVNPGSSSNANVSQVTDDVDSPAASSTIQPRSDAAQVRPHNPPTATKRAASLHPRDASNLASSLVDDDVRITPAPLVVVQEATRDASLAAPARLSSGAVHQIPSAVSRMATDTMTSTQAGAPSA